MIPFALRVKGYKGLMNAYFLLTKIVTLPKPSLFTGPGSSVQLCETIGQMGIERVLIVTDKVLLNLGLLDKMKVALTSQGVAYEIYDGILPDPTNIQVDAGYDLLKQTGCTAVLAVGGGSAIDAAKVIAARGTNNKTVDQLTGILKVWTPPLPLFAIPTTAGTGSECTAAAVISHPETGYKQIIADPKLVPVMAALDGALMTGLPKSVTAATGLDALTHAVEAYISAWACTETDNYATAAVRLVMENLPKVMANGQDLEARQNMAQAAYFGGAAFVRAGVGYVHTISHSFGKHYHTPHGLGNAVALPKVLEFYQDTCEKRLAELALISQIGDASMSDAELAQRFIDRIKQMLVEFDIPARLDSFKKADIPVIAKEALDEAHFNCAVPKYMTKRQCKEILESLAV